MFKEINELIKKYNNIAVARHVGVDPDAMAASCAMKNAISLTYPDKYVRLLGTGSNRFTYFGKLDKPEEIKEKTLLIVVDTPDIKRIDGVSDITKFDAVIKMDHHPFIEKYATVEYIDTTASSAAQIILEFLNNSELLMDKMIAEQLFWGIVSDTNRFMYNNTSPKTFKLISELYQKYELNISELYEKLYARPLSEVRLEGYIASNMKVTPNKVGFIKITNETLEKFGVDAASPGNMIGNFNYIDEVIVWLFITEDIKNENIRISIRSRGPIINTIAEKFGGGGHNYASGARLQTWEETEKLVSELDSVCQKYIKEKRADKNENN